jgi:hypothetical protein
MHREILLPRADGAFHSYAPVGDPIDIAPVAPQRSRVAYAAAHVVCDPLADNDLTIDADLDWEATLFYRRYLWSLGLSVAEAMDTAQRGMGLGWETSRDLIRHSIANARAESPEDYAEVYGAILSQITSPVIIHWLGEMFDPALSAYWGHRDLDAATEVCLSIIDDYARKIDGIKVSFLDASREVEIRRRLPDGVTMYTGDDFDYPDLILGDEQGFSHALLGIFDAIATAAALQELDAGDTDRYEEILAPTVLLSRHIFQFSTRYYKTGVVFLAYETATRATFEWSGDRKAPAR